MNKRIERASRQLQVIKVRRADQGRSLREVLSSTYKLSNRQAKTLLDTRRVLVNGQRVWMAHHALKAGDIIESPLKTISAPGENVSLEIVKKAPPYLVVAKPAGLLSNGKNSTESRLRRQLEDETLLAVHRLDRDTSGCLIFARGEEHMQAIIPVFRERRVVKVYHTIVLGSYGQDQTTLHTMIGEEEALTHVRCLSRTKEASYLAIRISTGRRHQIRKQMAKLRHPVLGDPQYGPKRVTDPRFAAIPRQMLHARDVEFPNPETGEAIRAHAPLPPDFARTLRSFELH